MGILKKALIILLSFVVLCLVIALFVSKEFHYEKSIVINAPQEVVWEHVNSHADLDKWSPWDEKDPNMKKTVTGTDGTVGAMQAWDSEVEEVGKGSQTFTKLEPPSLMEADLKFYTPYESEAKAFIKVSPEGSATKVTWGFDSEMPYPFNIMKLFMNVEKSLDPDFNNGLNKLKSLCENPT
jgi:ligand-binding SRPBCC domain-containing protein